MDNHVGKLARINVASVLARFGMSEHEEVVVKITMYAPAVDYYEGEIIYPLHADGAYLGINGQAVRDYFEGDD